MLPKSEANQLLELIRCCVSCQTESDLSGIMEKLKEMKSVDLRATRSRKSLARALAVSDHLQPHLQAATRRALRPRLESRATEVILGQEERNAVASTVLDRLWDWQNSLLDNLPDLVMRFDIGLRCIFANRAVRDVLGVDPAMITGKDCASMGLSPDAAKRMTDVLRKVTENGHSCLEDFDIEVNGADRYLSFRAAPVTDGGTAIRSILVIGTDVTHQRSLEAHLRETQKMEALGVMSGGIAHDFNNLLAVVLGNSELALDDIPEDSPVFGNIQNIRTAALRSRDLIHQILTFARRTTENRKTIPIFPLVRETAELLRSTIPAAIELKVGTRASRDAVVADASQIQQVLVNLGMNAAQAMPDRGTLTISVDETSFSRVPDPGLQPGAYLAISVTDTGHGMDDKTRERIFEPFFTTKSTQGGTGLGLSVVYGIVRAHRGVVKVRSTPGKGSTFTVLLPLAKATTEDQALTDQKEIRGGGRILIVDDDELIVHAARSALSRLGYEVVAETNPRKGLSRFADSGHFDLVITDYTMPGMSGLAFAKALFKKQPRLPIILCTGYSMEVDEETAKAAGFRAFLMKPYTRMQLASAVSEVLHGASPRQEAEDGPKSS